MRKSYRVIKESSLCYDNEVMLITSRKREAEKEKRRLERIEDSKHKYYHEKRDKIFIEEA